MHRDMEWFVYKGVYWDEKIVKVGGFFAFEQEDHEDDEMVGDLANANRPGNVRV